MMNNLIEKNYGYNVLELNPTKLLFDISLVELGAILSSGVGIEYKLVNDVNDVDHQKLHTDFDVTELHKLMRLNKIQRLKISCRLEETQFEPNFDLGIKTLDGDVDYTTIITNGSITVQIQIVALTSGNIGLWVYPIAINTD